MAHRWRSSCRGGASEGRQAEGLQGEALSDVGMEVVDVSFNPSGFALSDEGHGLCSIVRCDNVVLHSKENNGAL